MCIGNDDSVRLRRTRQVTVAELSKHDLKEDSWIAIRGRVYDVTDFGRKHPGKFVGENLRICEFCSSPRGTKNA